MDGLFHAPPDPVETRVQASVRLGVPVYTLSARAKRLGLPALRCGRPPSGQIVGRPRSQWDRCAHAPAPLAREGVPVRSLVAPFGFSVVMLRAIFRRAHVRLWRSRGLRSRHPLLVTYADAHAAVTAFLQKESLRQAAVRTGVRERDLLAWLREARLVRAKGPVPLAVRFEPAVIDRVVAARKAKEAT